MMQKLISCSLIMFLISLCCVSAYANKGAGAVVRVTTEEGELLELYNNSYALLIGVSQYNNGWPRLGNVQQELDQVEQVLRQQGFSVIRIQNPDEQALKDAFENFIDNYGYEPENRLLFFYSGHGYSFPNTAKGYLVPTDAANPNFDKIGFLRKAVPMEQILTWSRKIQAKHALFLFDSCFSGTVFKAKALPNIPPHITRLSTEAVRQYITAGGAGDEVPSKSTFTPVFVDALKYQLGDINGDGYITGTELGMYLEKRVPESIRQIPQYGKIPDYELSRGDFIFVASKKVSLSQDTYLTIDASPEGANVQLLNIDRKYFQGIKLKPGSYHIEVSKPGYNSYKKWLEFPQGDINHRVVLEEDSRNAPKMVELTAGCYAMGSPVWETGHEGDERQHEVCVKKFQIASKEVTIGEFRKFVRATGYRTQAEQNLKNQGCNAYDSSENKWAARKGYYWDHVSFSQNDQHPVVCVSWYDVQSYIDWMNENSAGGYRLPTEAEWEYAARGGLKVAYFWGSEVDSYACRYANVNDKNWANEFPCDDGYEYTAPVGSYRTNDFKLYDISGNVLEWTCSKYEVSYASTESPCRNKKLSNNADNFVLRGGSFTNKPHRLRVAYRFRSPLWERYDYLGFRLARTR